MREGDLLEERFRIERRAGEGAMGTVFRARDLRSAQPVAVKVFRRELAAPAPAPRFAREAEVLAGLRADGVVGYVHHGERDGRPFLVMEWIDGPTLADALRAGAMQPFAALQLAQRLAGALAAVHAAGIVHRDLKPGNVMLPGGALARACLVDFGIARIPDGTAHGTAAITTQRGQLGTPRYMAPEQIRDAHAVDGRADVFALGCVLFECLTGAPAFGGDDPISVLARILFEPALEPSALHPALPVFVDRLLERLLARERTRRPDSATLARELAQLASAPALIAELAALPSAAPHASRSQRAPSQLETVDAPAPASASAATARESVPPLRLSSELLNVPLQASGVLEPWSPLLGREHELHALSAELAQGAAIALWGAAGVGKTRLALELAQRARPGSPLLVVELGAVSSTEDAVRDVAARAGLVLPPTDQPERLVGALLAKLGPVVLVLDRVERLAGQIEPLIQLWTSAAPGLQLIATSRLRLRLAGAFELGPLATAERLAPEPTRSQPSAAARLLLARARALLPELPPADGLDAGTALALERVASALDGVPLALELAAARVSVLGFDGLLARLSAPLELLAEPGTAGGDAMRAALAWSWSLLGEHERSVLMQCALFDGGFELDAAQAVIALPPGAPPLAELLQALREQSLLVARAAAPDRLRVRFALLAAVREFARELWTPSAPLQPELRAAHERHARHYAARARAALELADGTAVEAFAHERDNAIAAVSQLLAREPGDARAALWLLRALEPELLARGPSGELGRLLERALTAALARGGDQADPELALELAAARHLRARLLAPAGQHERAQQELRAVVQCTEQLAAPAFGATAPALRGGAVAGGGASLQGRALLDLGVAQHFARELAPAELSYQRALALLSDCGDAVGEARCLGNLAAIAHDRARLQDALDGYRRAIGLLSAEREPRLLANFYGNRALCEHELGQLPAALASYRQALAMLEPLGDARLLGIVLSNFATLELEQAHAPAALALHERACALLAGAGDPRSHALARGRRAVALAQLERADEAERECAAAERTLRRDPLDLALVALLRAFVQLAHARRAARDGAAHQAQRELAAAEQRFLTGRDASLQDRSDDARLFLRLLGREIDRVRGALGEDPET